MKYDMDAATLMTMPGDSWETGGDPLPYNPSYFSPAHYSLFASATGDSKWTTAVTNGYDFMANDCSNRSLVGSGLVPDWTESLSSCKAGSSFIDW